MSQEEKESSHPTEQLTSNRRIAKNTLMLYLRMLLSTLVSLYTSRIVLQVLGVEDYGIYGLVGGMVGLFSFLNNSMAGATSRFITFELGRGDKERLSSTFCSAFIVHLIIAAVVFILAETIGLWLLCQKLVIPQERILAAHVVYQLSILSTMIGITQVPYNSLLIAHEKFNVYAYVEILNVTLKLLIVFLLQVVLFDKLIFYAILGVCVSVTLSLIYRFYCRKHFPESELHLMFKKDYVKPMLSFSGYDLYGNGCVSASSQGRNFIINIFYGVALNAASTVATTVTGVVNGLAYNVIAAYRPVIIKLYARGEIRDMERIMLTAAKFSSFIFGCVSIPLVIDMDYVLRLWLGNPPQYSALFCQMILSFSMFGTLNSIQTAAIHATGKIKKISFISGTYFLLTVPITYVAFKLGMPPVAAYVIQGAMSMMILTTDIIIVKIQIPTINVRKQVMGLLMVFINLFAVSFLSYFVFGFLYAGFIGLLLLVFINLILMTVLSILLLFDKEERKVVFQTICNKFSIVKK